MSTPSLAALKRSPASVRDSVSEAAAKTTSVFVSAADAVSAAIESADWDCVPPHATNPRPAAMTAANANDRLVMLVPAMVPSFPSV